jgi:thiol-disulfide isomerase/thioredoxin
MTKNFISNRILSTGSLAVATLFTGLLGLGSVATADKPTLTIGSNAPALDIEHWVSDNDGKFDHITELKSGKVYVVEFWATWCGPCIASMPHLSETQEKHADQDVQIISVTREELEKVESFLEKDVRGDDEKTYRELTSNYCLTVDPDKSVYNDYFSAAGQRGIPCAFIVGKTGKIEWIGHPMSMDSPLEQVVEDKWDRDAFLIEFEAQKKKKAQQRLVYGVVRAAGKHVKSGKFDAALEAIDTALEEEKFEFAKPQLEDLREKVLDMQVKAKEKEEAKAEAEAEKESEEEKEASEDDSDSE